MKFTQFLLALLLSISAFAQTKSKTDKIYLNDGSVLEVNVKKVAATVVEYTYPNETAQNEESLSNVRTIVFASGRVQQFNATSNATSAPVAANNSTAQERSQPEYRDIKQDELAILPVAFIDKRTGNLSEDKSKLAQAQIYDFFDNNQSKITPIHLQDGRTTNGYLKKSGISIADLDEVSIEELEKVLGVEYLILSKVSYTAKSNVTTNESTYGKNEKKGNKDVVAVHSTSTSNENTSYAYMVVLEIYQGGKKIYNETREPFFTMEDSWKDAYEYMLKRTPIYRRK